MTTDPAFWHRLQFAFTITYHYIFPQLTMGLAWFLVFWKWRALRAGDEHAAAAARFWARIFGLTFALGVVTGIPMEFQFGTNWAAFSTYAGGVVGQTLAMEGMFAFLLESAFIGALVWGEARLGPRLHFLAAIGVATGSWLSAYFIVVTNAFMQHPVGHAVAANGTLVTGAFAVAAVGAFYSLRGAHPERARLFLRHGTAVGLAASVLAAFPTGDAQAKIVARYQPQALAAMEGRFETAPMAEITLIGQPNVAERRLDNPIRVPGMLSFLAFGTFHSDVQGLLLALLLGVALGNVVRGVPVGADGTFSMSLFTDFGVRGHVGILDWYTASVGLFAAIVLSAHGAVYLAATTTGGLRDRSVRVSRRLTIGALLLFPVVTVMTWSVRPGFFTALLARPAAWLAIGVVAAGALALGSGLRQRRQRRALLGSCAAIAGLLGSIAAAVFPVMLHSTIAPELSVTAYAGASDRRGLSTAAAWWPLALVLALAYVIIATRSLRKGHGDVPRADS